MPASLTVDVTRSGTVAADLAENEKALRAVIARLSDATRKDYDTDYAFLNVPIDVAGHRASLAAAKKLGKVDLLVLIGIGGSNLGTLAVAQAIRGSLQNLTASPALLCADTVDARAVHDIVITIRDAVKQKLRVGIIIVSKSGTTTETVANANIILDAFKTLRRDWQRSVIAITDKGSALWSAAEQQQFITVEIPKKLGGRYSVLSAVGLVPLAILGINTKQLLVGAAAMRTRCLAAAAQNPAALLALAQYVHIPKQNITDYFVFGSDLEGIGKWYRQLLGESCGKDGHGITPAVAVGSTDLHSIGQLALGGPADKFTIFVETAKDLRVVVPKKPLLTLVPAADGKDLGVIMRAIAEGTRRAYADAKRPYATITLPQRDAYAVGELLQLHMTQTVMLGALLRVNPFDQPAVELYKEHTRALLAKSK